MTYFLVIHARYLDTQIALFKEHICIDLVTESNQNISKNLIHIIMNMFSKSGVSLPELSFIAAHQGPAPFTTLRVSLACVNGLNFSTGIPLVGINGLETFLKEYQNLTYITVALLNAFCQDLYFGINNPYTNQINIGFARASDLLNDLAHMYSEPLIFIGNGAKLYQTEIQNLFKERAIITDLVPEIVSINAIAAAALEKWNSNESTESLMPLYLKDKIPDILCQPKK